MSNDKFGRIIALSQYFKSLRYIQKDPNAFGILKEPTYDTPIEFGLNDCWRWQLVYTDSVNLEWREVYDFKDTEELYNAILNIQKVAAIDFITTRIRRNTRHISRYLRHQEKIYFYKYIEACDILKSDVVDALDGQYPFVDGYAKIIDSSLQDAARDIKLQYENRNATVAEYENMRLKYFKRILDETKIENLKDIVEQFMSDREY
jgi:hypothetical protein